MTIILLPDYGFYIDIFFGESIPEENFPRLAVRADREIQYFERIWEVTGTEEQRHKAVCAVAEDIFAIETATSQIISANESGSGGVTSISIGSIGTSYKAPDVNALQLDLSEKGQKTRFENSVKLFMCIYKGVSRCR